MTPDDMTRYPAPAARAGGRAWPGDPSGRTALVRFSERHPAGLSGLAASGYRQARTGALAEPEASALLERGWSVAAHLHLLTHSLERLPPEHPRSGPRLRRGSPADLPTAVALDDDAFPPEWRLGISGLSEALRATPQSRLRLAREGSETIGYAICGRAGRDGYVQRLAVARSHRRRGLGRALTLDGLRWLKRWRVTSASVNTYVGNDDALRLYRSLGFVDVQPGLMVLTIEL